MKYVCTRLRAIAGNAMIGPCTHNIWQGLLYQLAVMCVRAVMSNVDCLSSVQVNPFAHVLSTFRHKQSGDKVWESSGICCPFADGWGELRSSEVCLELFTSINREHVL